MQLDWERDVRPAAEAEGRNLQRKGLAGEWLASDLASVSWEVMQSGREFDCVQHVLSVAKLRIKRRMHLDRGKPLSIDGVWINGKAKPRREAGIRRVESRETASPESDGRLDGWLAALTPKQREFCTLLLAGWTMQAIFGKWGAKGGGSFAIKGRIAKTLAPLAGLE